MCETKSYAWGRESKVRNSKGEVVHNASSYERLIEDKKLYDLVKEIKVQNAIDNMKQY